MNAVISFINLLDAGKEIKRQVRHWRNEDFVRCNMFNTHIITEDEHEKYLSRLQESAQDKCYIAFHNNEPFGVLNLHIDPEYSRLEFGYYLTSLKYLDGGYGAILEYAILNHAFSYLNLYSVFCRTLSANRKVVALHKRFGFEVTDCDEGICRQSISAERWKDKKPYIESILNSVFPVMDIGKLE